MAERMYTSQEVRQIASEAARRVLEERPVPSTLTTEQAAEILGVSTRTIQRLNPRRVGSKIPYLWVRQQLEVR